MSRNQLYGLIAGYCTVSIGNRMVSTFQLCEFLHSFEETCKFFHGFWKFLSDFRFTQPQEPKEQPLGIDYRLLYSF